MTLRGVTLDVASAASTYGIVEGLQVESVETTANGRSFGRLGHSEKLHCRRQSHRSGRVTF